MYFFWSLTSIVITAILGFISYKLNTFWPLIFLIIVFPSFPFKHVVKEEFDEDEIPYDKDANNINNILRFIGEFKQKDPKQVEDLFLNGYCYWFAWILYTRFGGRIYYVISDNHFIVKIYDRYYDISGTVDTSNLQIIPWDEYKYYDKNNYNAIVRNCIKKSENMW